MLKSSTRTLCAIILPVSACVVFVPVIGNAQTVPAPASAASATALPALSDGKRIFLPAYFAADRPQTAMDMVGRVPGFGIEDGDSVRGFGGSAGNVLIDGARPTSKSETLEAILARIPAANVERVELLEGAAASALAPGKALVVNIVRKSDSASAGSWSAEAKGYASGRILPTLDASYTAKVGALNLTIGLEAMQGNATNLVGFEGFQNAAGVFLERGPNNDRRRNGNGKISLAADGAFGAYKISSNASWFQSAFRRRWNHVATLTGASLPYRLDEGREANSETNWEIGADIERDLFGWTSKAAVLVKNGDQTQLNLAGFNLIGAPQSFDRFVSQDLTDERVGRLTFKRKLGAHQIEFGGEYAFNSLDYSGVYAVGSNGAFVVQPSDISATEVTEDRREAFVSDSWTLSPTLTLEGTLTGEWSTISQSGDAAKERSFFYPKPRIKAIWKPVEGWTYRGLIERDVGQLDFGAFADSASIGDGNQNSGNPELRPEQILLSVLEVERRWGKRGVLTASLRYAQIDDKLTLVPIGGGGVALGNVDGATEWGYNLSWTLPLDFILPGLETETSYKWRDSEQLDPLAGSLRPFAGGNGNFFSSNIRYDIPARKLRIGAWLWRGDVRREYRNDQVVQFGGRTDWGVWIETKAIDGFTLEFGLEEPTGNKFSRVRTDYFPDRRSGNVSRIQYRQRETDGTWYLSLKGKF